MDALEMHKKNQEIFFEELFNMTDEEFSNRCKSNGHFLNFFEVNSLGYEIARIDSCTIARALMARLERNKKHP